MKEPNDPLIEEVDRLGRDRLDGRLDLIARPDAGRVETVGAGVREGLEPSDGLVEIGPPVQEAFGARREHHVAAGLVDRRARGLHARKREVEVVERIGVVAGEILNRQPGDAGLDAARHVLGDVLGFMGEAVLEIGVERQVGRCRDLAVVRQTSSRDCAPSA